MKSCEYPECGCDAQRAKECPGNWEIDMGGAWIRKEEKTMKTVDLSVKDAEAFLAKHDRHYKAPVEAICAIGVGEDVQTKKETCMLNTFTLHGAAILGRREPGVGELAHIYVDGVSQGYSLLYGACWRALKALGYEKAVL